MSLAGFKSIPLPLAQCSLPAVLKCGQSFRWSVLTPSDTSESASASTSDIAKPDIKEPEAPRVEYRLCLKDRVVCLRQSPTAIYYRSVFPGTPSSNLIASESDATRDAETLAWLRDYFQLDIDLVALYKQWAEKDKVFSKFQERFEGIRILRQDPWENLVSFICSSNNNISRITKMVQNLCTYYSPSLLTLEHPFIADEVLAYHPFPPPSALAGSNAGQHLRTLGFGYRADFIQRTAKMLVDDHGLTTPQAPANPMEASEIWLLELRKSSTDDARAELLKFVGVGRKVADCVLLMSMDKKEVVPVDTHVYQIAVKQYGMKGSASGKPSMTPKLYEDINAKFKGIWGDYAGWAHTVLFTADLKSFATYGLPAGASPSPSSSPSPRKRTVKSDKMAASAPALLQRTSSDSPLKRKVFEDPLDENSLTEAKAELSTPELSKLVKDTEEHLSIVERVKRRKRNDKSAS
ncbi:hypothetical protein D9619_005934 [Psilocybe cf. subviscida]|uniref:DNA-(apurinic or apyrimidinic site) lyase n=1 Tax=Psilocybe cf. subviscida TaxID=2480587 RepID=A0A8H5FBT4_9AGAR|nr:hypothetical protein D9619_005934 [Psilocybe cf. subviscida]